MVEISITSEISLQSRLLKEIKKLKVRTIQRYRHYLRYLDRFWRVPSRILLFSMSFIILSFSIVLSPFYNKLIKINKIIYMSKGQSEQRY